MNTVVLEVRSLSQTLSDASRAIGSGRGDHDARIAFSTPDVKAVHGDVTALLEAGVLRRTSDGKVEFPFDAVKVEFMLQAA